MTLGPSLEDLAPTRMSQANFRRRGWKSNPRGKDFADLSLTTWVPRLSLSNVSCSASKIQWLASAGQLPPCVYNPYTLLDHGAICNLLSKAVEVGMNILEFSALSGLARCWPDFSAR